MEIKVENKLIWYLLVCFATSFILDFFFEDILPINELMFYLPGLIVIGIYLLQAKKSVFKYGALGLSLKGFKYWILAPLFISFVCFLSYVGSVILNPTLLNSEIDLINTLKENGFYFGNIGFGILSIAIINVLLGSLVNIASFLGQELGWRAFMQVQLLKTLKPTLALFIGGIIWGVWTFLFVADSFKSSSSALVNLFLVVLFCIPTGIILQYFYKKSQSIFVAALAHASLYNTMKTASLFISVQEMNNPSYGPMGVVGIVLFSIVALILLIKSNRQNKLS